MKAMILARNQRRPGKPDCGRVRLSALDPERGWLDLPGPKTGIPRRCPLAAGTVQASASVFTAKGNRRTQRDAGLAFVTKYGKAGH